VGAKNRHEEWRRGESFAGGGGLFRERRGGKIVVAKRKKNSFLTKGKRYLPKGAAKSLLVNYPFSGHLGGEFSTTREKKKSMMQKKRYPDRGS